MSSAPCDLVVVGAGPAGLATAIAAAQHDLSAVVLERRADPPLDKACGEGIMPGGVAALARLGVISATESPAALGRPFVGIRFRDGSLVADGDFPYGHGLGVRRTRLHRRLVRRARELGIEVRWGQRVVDLTEAGVETSVGEVRAHWTVGADGLLSRVRRWAGLDGRRASRLRFGVRRHYRMTPWSRRVEVGWSNGAEAYVTPTADDEVGVALLWSGESADFDRLLDRFPRLVTRLADAEVVSRDRGAGPFEQHTRDVVSGRVLLVGDAAGYVDAVTGEGVGLALRQAEALAAALARDDPNRYRRDHRRIVRLSETLTRLLLGLERRPRLRHRVLSALRDDERLFSELLGLHAGQLSLRELRPSTLWRLALGVVGGLVRGASQR